MHKQQKTGTWREGNRNKVAISFLALTILLAYPPTCRAILGFGDVVFDPSSYAALGAIWSEDISTGMKVAETIKQGTAIIKNGKDLYDVASFMATHLTDKSFMESFAATAGDLVVHDKTGATTDMARIMNGDYRYGAEAGTAVWAKASSKPGDPDYLKNDRPGESARLARYATAGLLDAAAVRCLGVQGQYSSYDIKNRLAALALKALHLDNSKKMNTYGVQQNINNGFAHQQLTELQTSNALHSCEVALQVAEAKEKSDHLKEQTQFEAERAHAFQSNPESLSPQDTVEVMKQGAVSVFHNN